MWTIVITIRDSKGATSKLELHFPGVDLLANIITFIEGFLPLLDAVIGGVVMGYSANYSGDLDGLGLKTEAATGADVEEGASFIWGSAGGYQSRFRIPTFLESKIANDSRQVNQLDTAVANLRTYVLAGVAGAFPSDSRGALITSLVSAKELFQKSRRV